MKTEPNPQKKPSPQACVRCGSERIIPELSVRDHYGDAGGFVKGATVAIHGNPNAWFFMDTTIGKIVADVCGDCGHMMLRIDNVEELYAKYIETQARKVAGP